MFHQQHTPSILQHFSTLFISSVVWHEWITENPGKCKEQCCDVGGDFTFQIRNCTINRQRCNLDKCENYGAIKREVPCKTACDCMSNAGRSLPSPRKMVQYFCETKFQRVPAFVDIVRRKFLVQTQSKLCSACIALAWRHRHKYT